MNMNFYCSVTLAACAMSPMWAQQNLKLHYSKPASFFEEAFVMGNGTMGATVYGDAASEQIELNDITFWTGEPIGKPAIMDAEGSLQQVRQLLNEENYKDANRALRKIQGPYSQNYQPIGTLRLEQSSGTVRSYNRELNISNATAKIEYTTEKGSFERSYFVSAPDSLMVIRCSSKDGAKTSSILSFNSQQPCIVTGEDGQLVIDGFAAYQSLPSYYKRGKQHFWYDPDRGIHFRTVVRVVAGDAKVSVKDASRLELKDYTQVTLLVSTVTSFNGFDKDPAKEGWDYKSAALQRIDRAQAKTYDALYDAHTADFRHFFDRLTIDLGDTDPQIAQHPTDVQLKNYTDSAQVNPDLEELYMQYGRYLLISSSRTPGVPANLQGLWNHYMLPPWSCNYTVNINVEENYWAAETANLGEMHQSLLGFIRNLSKTGQETAKAYFNIPEGWCVAHNSDIWALSNPVGMHEGNPSWANWNMGGAWLVTHIWEHYLFSQDKSFLEDYYPVLKGAADFCLNWMVERNGEWITSPSTSPENIFKTPDGGNAATCYGGTADLAMIRECLLDTYAAAETLNLDKKYRKRIEKVLNRMHPYQVGVKGNLQEWFYDWEDADPQHRHQSHLFGLYPGHHITLDKTPKLAKACAKTLQIKGDNTTGWSTGWRVNLYARLHDAEGAYRLYRRLLKYVSPDGYKGVDKRTGGGTYPNLLDAHSPFQIDGNFGGCAGVLEMLVQSTEKEILLLPATPKQWNTGRLKGVRARGGFELDMTWKQGRVTSLMVSTLSGGKTSLVCNGKRIYLNMKPGETRKIKL